MNPEINGQLWTQFITLLDYLLLPLYLLLAYIWVLNIRNKSYPNRHPWRKFFLAGFSLKIFGALFIGLVYQYYYQGGDTSAFFYHAKVINQSFSDSPVKWINLLLHIPSYDNIHYYTYTQQMMWYNDQSSYLVCSITALVSLFTFNTYLPTSVLFAAFSFSGIWAMFRTFAIQYPKYTKQIAIATLFIPSTFIWGSGIFKDTICLAALGWLTFCAFHMLIQRKFRLKYFIIVVLCFYLLAVIKIYILLVFLPALTLWILYTYSHKISSIFFRNSLKVVVLSFVVMAFMYFTSAFSKELGRYSLDNVAATSYTTRSYLEYVSTDDQGSGYNLGAFDPSIQGMLKKFPLAVNVTLFRPYLWEAKKPIVFFNALEAFLFLFLTIKLFFNPGLKGIYRSVQRNPNIQFFLVFTLIFAFAVGISTYNFGALSRYRIPCLPFYALSLLLIYYDHNSAARPFFNLKLK